jgi:hypothetical protein
LTFGDGAGVVHPDNYSATSRHEGQANHVLVAVESLIEFGSATNAGAALNRTGGVQINHPQYRVAVALAQSARRRQAVYVGLPKPEHALAFRVDQRLVADVPKRERGGDHLEDSGPDGYADHIRAVQPFTCGRHGGGCDRTPRIRGAAIRVPSCAGLIGCRYQFSVTAGTISADRKRLLRDYLLAIAFFI